LSRTFPPDSVRYLKLGTFLLAALGALVVMGIWYYGSPAYARVGYQPVQPVRFSHAIHAGRVGLDCTFCHNHVGESPHANVPSTQTCLNCHSAKLGNIKATSAALAPLREAEASGRPIAWARIHKVPDYAYFNHAVHVSRGVACVSCHGRINEMEVVRHVEPLTMSWCLECHRDPWPQLRPADKVTDFDWTSEPILAEVFAEHLSDVGIRPPQDCSGCHR